jgi:Mg-chelatase subunit ChlD
VSQYGGKPLSEAMEVAEEIEDDPRVNKVVIDVEKSELISFGLAHQLSARIGTKYFRIEDLRANT